MKKSSNKMNLTSIPSPNGEGWPKDEAEVR
jgi:hypothetical protein